MADELLEVTESAKMSREEAAAKLRAIADQLSRHNEVACAFWLGHWPLRRVSALTVSSGRRWRALQYPPVRTLHVLRPSAARCAAQPLTAFWHEPSASSTWRMNIDNVTVGGYSRSRCSGNCASVVSSNCGLVSTLKNSTALVDLARLSMLRRR